LSARSCAAVMSYRSARAALSAPTGRDADG